MSRQLGCDNCNGNTLNLGAAPSWYDNAMADLSAGADNIWQDVQGAGVWAEDEIQGFWTGMQNSPANPIQAGSDLTASAGLTDIPGQIGTGLSNLGQDISGGVSSAFNSVLLFGGLAIVAIVLLEKKGHA